MTKRVIESVLKAEESNETESLRVTLNFRDLSVDNLEGKNYLCIPVSEVQSLEPVTA